MKSTNHNNSSTMRDFLWFVYKWFLIGLAVYLCYICLHLSPLTFDLIEIFLCSLIIIGFAAVIKHHDTAKKAREQPDKLIIPSPLAIMGGMLSWVMYAGLLLYVCFQIPYLFGDSFEINPIFELVMASVIWIIWIIQAIFPRDAKKPKKSILDPFGYLK